MPPRRAKKQQPVVEETQETKFQIISIPIAEPVDTIPTADLPPIAVHEYEEKMNFNIRRIIAVEDQFSKTMALLKQAKINSLRKKRQEVINGKGEEFLWRRGFVDEERDKKVAVHTQWLNLHMDRCQRTLDARIYYAESSLKDNMVNFQERLVEKLREQEKKELKELKEAKMTAGLIRLEIERNRGKTMAQIQDWERKPCYYKLNYYRRLLDYPVIIHQANKWDIKKDVEFCERAALEAEIRETIEDEKNLEGLADSDEEAEFKMSLDYEPAAISTKWREEEKLEEEKRKNKLATLEKEATRPKMKRSQAGKLAGLPSYIQELLKKSKKAQKPKEPKNKWTLDKWENLKAVRTLREIKRMKIKSREIAKKRKALKLKRKKVAEKKKEQNKNEGTNTATK